jgi:hypothetical protein
LEKSGKKIKFLMKKGLIAGKKSAVWSQNYFEKLFNLVKEFFAIYSIKIIIVY